MPGIHPWNPGSPGRPVQFLSDGKQFVTKCFASSYFLPEGVLQNLCNVFSVKSMRTVMVDARREGSRVGDMIVPVEEWNIYIFIDAVIYETCRTYGAAPHMRTADVRLFSRTFRVDFVYYLLDLINDAVCLQIVRFLWCTALFYVLNIFLVCIIVAAWKRSRHDVSHLLCCFPRICVDVVV